MEIHFHLRTVDAVGKAYAAKPANSLETRSAEDEVALENARALKNALDETPMVRDEVVHRASELIGDVNYPPPETIRMISHLLAINIQDGDQAEQS
jgi:hypothetical protein